ncbi:MAG: AbgT family transporter [Phycisphaeraceae bacterium]|nr:AbgT family transporter [Phycisphaeraceae bacterium]MBX3406068.1 AbgT family transporter [Phycisphaeraceae bacterium]
MSSTPPSSRFSLLDAIEWAGNKLPDPAMLFVWCCLVVIVLSAVSTELGWSVQPVRPEAVMQTVTDPQTGASRQDYVIDANGRREVRLVEVGDPIASRSLLTSDGIFWMLRTMVRNFVDFPPLGVVLVTMLGVGLAERAGLIGALLKAVMLVVPARFFTPMLVFLGIQSSMGADSGYVVLPPIAALMFKSVGRSPLAGVAAVFAGISAGFSSNLLVTSLDPLLGSLTQTGARVIEPGYELNAACNWWFLAASTFLLTLVGWAVTDLFVEPRLSRRGPDDGGPAQPGAGASELRAERLSAGESRALLYASSVLGVMLAGVLALIFIEGSPIYGDGMPDSRSPRWIIAIVPIIFFLFLVPGLVYGVSIGTIRSGRDVAKLMSDALASTAPVIVLAFFAGQFIAYFKYSQLDQLLAYSLGKLLAESGLPPLLLLAAFIVLVMVLNILVSSASAKWTLLAPVFVPIFMLMQVSPELTQAAYRLADSCTNIVTPLNAYLVLILAACRTHAPKSGTGTIISMMTPYSIVFAIVWTTFLLGWAALGIDLGPGGGLVYTPPSAAN